MKKLLLIILLLAGFIVKAQNPYIGRYYRIIAIDTTAFTSVPPTVRFPVNTGGFYYNVTTGYIMYKDATGYHKLRPGGGGGGGGGSIDAVNGTTNRITATGTTTRTLDISATFEALLGKVASPLSQFASTTSAQLRGVLSDEVGTGAFYTVGGALGTPASATGTNFTGIPITGLTTFTSAQLRTQLTDEVGSGAIYTVGGALGTPASGTLTNATGLPMSGITSSTSANLASLITDETGGGSVVFSSAPTILNANLATPSAITLTNGTGLPITGITSSTSAQLATLLSDEVGSGPLYFGQPKGADVTYAGSHTLIAADIGNNNSGVVEITGASASTFTIPTNATYAAPLYALVAILNNSSDTVTIAFAGGVTPIGNGDVKIGPYQIGSIRKKATNTWNYWVPGSGGSGAGDCAMAVSNETSTHSFGASDVAACNNTGMIRYTGSADVNFTMPLFATVPFEQGTTIGVNNQSAFNVTIVLTGGITGGGHSYPVIGPGQTATLINGGVDVWDILGTTPTSLSASATLDFASTAAGAITDLTVTVTGAAVGDVVSIGAPSIPNKGTYFGWVSATNTVTVRYANNDLTTAKDPSSGTFKIKVFK